MIHASGVPIETDCRPETMDRDPFSMLPIDTLLIHTFWVCAGHMSTYAVTDGELMSNSDAAAVYEAALFATICTTRRHDHHNDDYLYDDA